MIFKAKTGAIEIEGDEVRVAVCKAGGKMPAVLEMASRRARYEQPEERFEALVNALEDALDSLEHRPAAYVLCVSSLYSVVRTLTIPFRGRRRVSAAVQFELEPYLAFPIEDLLLDFDIVGEFQGETEVLAMGIRRAQLEETLAIIREAGIEVDAVNLDVAGLTGLWQGVTGRKKGLHAVLHVRASHAVIAVVYDGGLAFFRNISTDAAAIREHPAAAAREVQNSLRSFMAKWRGGGEISVLSVTGVSFSTEELEAFEQTLRLPVEEIPLYPSLKGGAAAPAEGEGAARPEAWEALLGVASSAAGDPYTFDFAQTTQTWQSSAPAVIKHVLFSACLALLMLLGMAFYFHQGTIRNNAETSTLQAKADALEQEILALGEKGLGSDVDARVFSDPTLLTILDEISKKMPGDKVNITEVKISPPEAKSWWMRIQGTVADAGVFNEVFNAMKGSQLFTVQDEPDLSLQGELTTFAVKMFRPDEAAAEGDAAGNETGALAAKETGSENQS